MRAIDRCAELLVKKELSTVEASKAKLLATELQGKVTDQCVQLHGYGYVGIPSSPGLCRCACATHIRRY